MEKRTVEDIDVAGKTVLVRVDFNVPFEPGSLEIRDDSRIEASLPTIRFLRDRRCRVVLCSHIGRPKGRVVEKMRMRPATRRLSERLGGSVIEAADCIGPEVEEIVRGLPEAGVAMLENLRFHPGEEANDLQFASALASLASVYVNDAFGTAHRAHASTEGVTRYLPAVAGFLLARELQMLGRALESPERPFTAVLGGAKVSDKIKVLKNLAKRADTLIVGGGMGTTFLKAEGLDVGSSAVEDDEVAMAAELITLARSGGPELLLPVDVVVADSFQEDATTQTVDATDIPPGWMVMDIGPRTAEKFAAALKQSRTVLWNGTMGVFEWASFAAGTRAVANTLAALDYATTVVGGGSTAEAVSSLGLAGRMTHVSTGGGASLEFLEDKVLPGVAALMDKKA
ncbi:MAG: phosphoglycerate kinase [Chloroflexi bacterium]|nr:phosphoglycerate kinase [Chloroflexota bacterium]